MCVSTPLLEENISSHSASDYSHTSNSFKASMSMSTTFHCNRLEISKYGAISVKLLGKELQVRTGVCQIFWVALFSWFPSFVFVLKKSHVFFLLPNSSFVERVTGPAHFSPGAVHTERWYTNIRVPRSRSAETSTLSRKPDVTQKFRVVTHKANLTDRTESTATLKFTKFELGPRWVWQAEVSAHGPMLKTFGVQQQNMGVVFVFDSQMNVCVFREYTTKINYRCKPTYPKGPSPKLLPPSPSIRFGGKFWLCPTWIGTRVLERAFLTIYYIMRARGHAELWFTFVCLFPEEWEWKRSASAASSTRLHFSQACDTNGAIIVHLPDAKLYLSSKKRVLRQAHSN